MEIFTNETNQGTELSQKHMMKSRKFYAYENNGCE